MNETFEFDVFLSYSSENKKIVHELAKRLKQDGLRVWLDEWEIQPGDIIPLKIQRGLEQSRTLLMCMSPAYFDSEWGSLEHYTLLFRDPTNAQRRFVPLLIEDCSQPDIIAQFAYIDWRKASDNQYSQLLIACRDIHDKIREPLYSNQELEVQLETELIGHHGWINTIVISEDGKLALSSSHDHTLRLWDLIFSKPLWILSGHHSGINACAISPDSTWAVSGADDSTICTWDLLSGKCKSVISNPGGAAKCVAILPDCEHFLSSNADGTIRMWHAPSGQCTKVIKAHSDIVHSVKITKDGKYAISGSFDHNLAISCLETGSVIAQLSGHTDHVHTLAISPDGRFAASGGMDYTIRLWNLEIRECVAIFEGHSSPIMALEFMPDGKSLISSPYGDEGAKFWNLRTGECIGQIPMAHEGLAVIPNGEFILSDMVDSYKIGIWRLKGTI